VASPVPNCEATQFKTGEKQVEIARKGGIASGEAKRKKATMLAVLEKVLDEKNAKGLTYRELVTLGLIKGATKGNAQNYKAIIEMLGEVPKEQFGDIKEPILNVIINGDDKLKEAFYEKEEQE
jgi:hypothetical protein